VVVITIPPLIMFMFFQRQLASGFAAAPSKAEITDTSIESGWSPRNTYRMFPFKTALNTSCLFPFRLGVKEQVSIAAEAGFEGIELWIRPSLAGRI